MSRGYGDIAGQIADVGRFAVRLRHRKGPLRWVVFAVFGVPLAVAVGVGVAEVLTRIF